jgi:hypothetical protein
MLGHEVQARRRIRSGFEQGMIRAARVCFDASGNGTMHQVSDFAEGRLVCEIPMRARFDNENNFVAQTPTTLCDDRQSSWVSARFVCARVNDAIAQCRSRNIQGTTAEMEFRRAQ